MELSKDETTWAMIAHLSNLVNLITGVLGPVIAIIIYLHFAIAPNMSVIKPCSLSSIK